MTPDIDLLHFALFNGANHYEFLSCAHTKSGFYSWCDEITYNQWHNAPRQTCYTTEWVRLVAWGDDWLVVQARNTVFIFSDKSTKCRQTGRQWASGSPGNGYHPGTVPGEGKLSKLHAPLQDVVHSDMTALPPLPPLFLSLRGQGRQINLTKLCNAATSTLWCAHSFVIHQMSDPEKWSAENTLVIQYFWMYLSSVVKMYIMPHTHTHNWIHVCIVGHVKLQTGFSDSLYSKPLNHSNTPT